MEHSFGKKNEIARCCSLQYVHGSSGTEYTTRPFRLLHHTAAIALLELSASCKPRSVSIKSFSTFYDHYIALFDGMALICLYTALFLWYGTLLFKPCTASPPLFLFGVASIGFRSTPRRKETSARLTTARALPPMTRSTLGRRRRTRRCGHCKMRAGRDSSTSTSTSTRKSSQGK